MFADVNGYYKFLYSCGFLDFNVDFWISTLIFGFLLGFLDFAWISGFQIGFLDFVWISGFLFGFLRTAYEISMVSYP